MSDFSLIKKMSEEPVKPLLPEGIAYKRFTIAALNMIVHIPLRESDAFVQAIAASDKITDRVIKSLLREFRGIKEPVDD